IINEIKAFLDGYNNDLMYMVDVRACYDSNVAKCIFHPPNGTKEIRDIKYQPFMYMKDLKRHGRSLYSGNREVINQKMIQYGIKIEKLKTGNQKRLVNGYCYKLTSTKSHSAISNFLDDGGIKPFERGVDENGNKTYPNRHLFYSPKPEEQFLISKGARLFKGFEEYKDVHKLTFDIETTGLRPEISRVFAIGVRDNKGNKEYILEVDKTYDDESEIKLIIKFIELYVKISPAIICGFNSEEFDFYYILDRLRILGYDIKNTQSTLKKGVSIYRKPNQRVKVGNTTDIYTATQIWGISVIDIMHAAKKTAAINTDIKQTNLKYLAKFEDVARENRTYIPGEDNDIGRFYHENGVFVANDKNVFNEIPKNFQDVSGLLYDLQQQKNELSETEYKTKRNLILKENPEFVKWFKKEALPQNMNKFVRGKELLRQYLSDDLWETEQIDELYNQSSFMLAKIVPTTFHSVCTRGTASIWNLLLTAWSYERGLAIPHPDEQKKFSGGLARCYKTGYAKRLVKIDYASLYPMEQLTWDIFPYFDISGVMKKMLIYMTTTRNIYKKLGKSTPLNDEEVDLMKTMDHEKYEKYINGTLTSKDRAMFNVKQLPIKILNNSQFGALGSNIAFNWSDNICAARITCNGRLNLRQAISWFKKYNCQPLLAVTDGVNFQIPDTTTIKVTNDGVSRGEPEDVIEKMWQYNGECGIAALIEKFNEEEMPSSKFMSVDNDGEFISTLNLSRINYALLQEVKDKKTGELKKKIKLTGNTIKSKTLPEYIEDFISNGLTMILEGNAVGFVRYYNEYVQKIFDMEIPIKKIASKSRFKQNIHDYLNRGKDKNGREKGKQAHMELVIYERKKIAEKLFQEHKNKLEFNKPEEELSISEKMRLVDVYMPPEPELDSTLYYYNTGYRKSHGDSSFVKDKDTGEMRASARLLDKNEMLENPDLKGEYNVDKYLSAFNSRVKKILVGFDSETAKAIIAKIKRVREKNKETKETKEITTLEKCRLTRDQIKLKNFDKDDFDESMHLEEEEVKFWNETGYDPRLVWDGFKMREDMMVHFEVYDNALEFVNDKMKKAGKKQVKSVNDSIKKGDFVLIKSGFNYNLGYNNGQFVKIIKENLDIPKSDYELELERQYKEELRIKEEEQRKLREEALFKNRSKNFKAFVKQFNLDKKLTFSDFLNDGEEAIKLLDEFIIEKDKRMEEKRQTTYNDIDFPTDYE
ncbi:MAG: 3'-5' exonuclease, partial [bacterium]